MRRRIAVIVVLLTGCAQADVDLSFPVEDAVGMESVVYAIERTNGSFEVSVALLEDGVKVEIPEDVERVRVLLYEEDVTRAFAEGTGRLEDTAPDGRSIPNPEAGWVWEVDDPTSAVWSRADEITGRLANFRALPSDNCEAFVTISAPFDFGGAEVLQPQVCDPPCAAYFYLSSGSIVQIDLDEPIAASMRVEVGATSNTGLLVHGRSLIGGYLGYEKGMSIFDGAGRWIPGPWSDRAVGYVFLESLSSWRAYAVTSMGVVYLYEGSWSRLDDFGPADERVFTDFLSPDRLEIFRGKRWFGVSGNGPFEHSLPVVGNVSSRRNTLRNGTLFRVLATDRGEALYQSGPDTWTILGDNGTTRKIIGVDYWRRAWFVFDDAGLLHQRREDGTICDALEVLEGPARGMFATSFGYYVWSDSELALVRLAENVE